MSRQPHPLCNLLVRFTLAASVATSSAHAADDLERARAVFHEALVLEVAGDWASALAKFQDVSRTRLTPQVRYHFARCKEHLGRITEALGDYRVAEAEARAAGLPETSEMERARRELEGRVPTLVLRGSSTAVGLQVELDGILLGPALYNQPVVINPGQHQITLRSSTTGSRTMLIAAEEGKRVEVDLLEQGSNSMLGNDPLAGVMGGKSRGTAPTWAYVAAGVGVASVVTSIALFVVRQNALNDLDKGCDAQRRCPTDMRDVQRRGQIASTLAPIALGLGIAGAGVGAWGFWGGSRGGSAQISAAGLPSSWGLNIAGEF